MKLLYEEMLFAPNVFFYFYTKRINEKNKNHNEK